MTRSLLALTAALLVACPAAAHAEHWLKVMPDDPYSKEGKFHMMDVDAITQESGSGLIIGVFAYTEPSNTVRPVPAASQFIWVFDCKKNQLLTPDNKPGWRDRPEDLSKPHMGGVTNTMQRKLCALSGSWPAGSLP
jgi:hypothetical protein